MASTMGVVAWPPRGGASSKSTWWAFGVKIWETLGVDTHLAPVTLGKLAACEPPFLRDDFVYLQLRCNLCFDHLFDQNCTQRRQLLGCVISSTVVGVMNTYASFISIKCSVYMQSMLHVRIDPLDQMEKLTQFFVDPRIDKPWESTLREKLPRSLCLRYINQGAKECQH